MAELNPFTPLPATHDDTSAPQVQTAGLVAGAMAPDVTAQNTASKVSTVDPSQFKGVTQAGTGVAANATSNGYDASTGKTTNWAVDPATQTVNGQVNSILAQDNPLIQKARSDAAATANSRGLLNSSMAVQAGESAVIDNALKIATPDAATYADAGKTNAAAANTTDAATQLAKNNAAQFGANAGNTASLQNANNQTDTSNKNAAAANSLQQQEQGLVAQAQFGNASAANDANKTDAANALTASTQNQDAKLKESMQTYDTATKAALQNADAASKLQLTKLDSDTKTTLANIQAKYNVQMQTSQSMAASYQSMVDNITKVMANPDLDAPAKQAAINNLTTVYNQGLQMQSNVSGLALGNLLNPSEFKAVAANTPAAGGGGLPYPYYGGGAGAPDGSNPGGVGAGGSG